MTELKETIDARVNALGNELKILSQMRDQAQQQLNQTTTRLVEIQGALKELEQLNTIIASNGDGAGKESGT